LISDHPQDNIVQLFIVYLCWMQQLLLSW